jgi:nitrogen fixation/metabolism regulation signal transduction histidine kinase
MRRLFAVLAISGGILGLLLWFLMLASASADTLGEQYPLILSANLVLVLTLLVLVGWQMRRLRRELRDKVFGARLKLRLMLMFGLVAVIPGALMYGVSVQFITRSIESWFDVRVEKALESGLDLGRSSLDYLQGELLQKAQGMAQDLAASADSDSALRSRLSRLREQSAVDSVALFAPNGQLLVSAQSDLSRPLPPLPTTAELKQQARASAQALSIIDDLDAGRMRLRVLIAVAPKNFFEPPRVLQLAQNVPENLSQNADAVQAVHRDYQELQLARQGLTQIYALSLTLTVLAALFSAFALAFVLARRLSAPLSILVEGTQAVAQGDYSPRQAFKSHDELGALTQSFNRMTRQLDDARREAERHRGEVEAARARLESILANLSAGVLVFDCRNALNTINAGAINILGAPLETLIGKPAAEWTTYPALGQFINTHFVSAAHEWQGQFEQDEASGQKKILLLRGAHLPAMSGGGHVVVFDDVTQLISAQRSAAWGEVARRLAHEIKNPLTPIQLSAERLQLKLADHLTEQARELLERSTQTIINQVLAMKRMVDDFRDYSQRSAPQFAALDLNALIREVLALYEHARMRVTPRLASDLPPVRGDANQLRQIIHNLLKNSEDALEAIAEPRLFIQTEKADAKFILLQISDNGEGFPVEMLARVFEPYITTKPRGTGLGLPIVKKIVEEHQGDIDVKNLAEGGACIRIRLPVAPQGIPNPFKKENSNG